MSKAEVVKQQRVSALLESEELSFIQFKGAAYYSGPQTKGFQPLTEKAFAPIAYKLFPGISKSGLQDVLHNVMAMAPDWSHYSHLVGFGDRIWNTRTLGWDTDAINYVYSSDIAPSANTKAVWQYLLQLAAGDEALVHDYLQSMAPLFMERRPSGVIWFVGDGANGKSSLINALYRLLGKYFASMTIASIEDGRDTPFLNGKLGNICRESSESRVEDTERYKAIGTHEPFTVHKFHSQDNIEVTTDFHTIFNANNVPVFSDKTKGARRRTLIIPFPAHFQDNPLFEDKTFTPEFLGGLITLVTQETHILRENGYRYGFSEATLRAKEAYDSEVNSAEAFVNYLIQSGVAGFVNYNILMENYRIWCGSNGFNALGITQLKRVVTTTVDAQRCSAREGGKVFQRYLFAEAKDEELIWIDNGYGMPNPKTPTPSNRTLSEEW